MKYAQTCANEQTGPTSFDSYVNNVIGVRDLNTEETLLMQHMTWLEQTAACMSLTSTTSTDGPLTIIRPEAVKTRSQLYEIV